MSTATPTPDSHTLSSATAFIKSYGSAINLTSEPTTTALTIAAALVRHYAPSFTAHDHGHKIKAPASDPDFWLTGVTTHLQSFQKSGLGWNMRLRDFRVEVVSESESVAKCFVTWSIEPLQGEGWAWTNVYEWRDGGEVGEDGLRGLFVSVISDDETEQLMRRVPGFLELEV